jgi:hypothetical protein
MARTTRMRSTASHRWLGRDPAASAMTPSLVR